MHGHMNFKLFVYSASYYNDEKRLMWSAPYSNSFVISVQDEGE